MSGEHPGSISEKGSFFRSLRNAGWLTGGRLFGDLAGLALFVAVARYYGPSGVGIYAFALAIGQFVFSATNMSMEDYAIRECASFSTDERRALISKLLGLQAFVALVFMGGFTFLLGMFGEDSPLLVAACILSAFQILLAVSKTLFIPAFAVQEMALPAVLELAAKVTAVAVSLVLLAALEAPLSVALLPFPAAGFVLVIASTISCFRHVGVTSVRFDLGESRLVLGKIWPFALSIIVFQVYARADVVMLTLLLDEAQAGLYASALKCLEVGGMPLFFVGVATYPVLSAYFASSDVEEFSKLADLMLRVTLTLAGLLAWGLFCIVPVLAVPVFGSEFSPTADIAKWLIGLAVLLAIAATLVRVMMAAHLQLLRVKLQSYAVLVNIALNLALIPLIGITGAILASVIAETLANAWYFREIRRINPVITRRLAKTLRHYAIAMSASAAAIWAFSLIGQSAHVIAGVSLLTFLLMLRAFRFVRMKDLLPDPSRSA